MVQIISRIEALLTPAEAAAYMKMSEKSGKYTVMRWVREGKLKAGRVGDLYRIRKADLDDMIFSRR